jgi:hypothetical protein
LQNRQFALNFCRVLPFPVLFALKKVSRHAVFSSFPILSKMPQAVLGSPVFISSQFHFLLFPCGCAFYFILACFVFSFRLPALPLSRFFPLFPAASTAQSASLLPHFLFHTFPSPIFLLLAALLLLSVFFFYYCSCSSSVFFLLVQDCWQI